MRVVSLSCSNTEIVCALGCADALVGVDDHSDFPVDVVSRLPRVGPDLTVDVDAIAALEPDLVLASLTVPGHDKNIASLEASGLPFIAPAPTSLSDVYRDVREIGRRLGVPGRAAALTRAMASEVAAATVPDATAGERPRVLVEWWPKPVIVPGRRSWVTDLLHLAGGENPLAGEAVESRPITADEAVAMAPDAVVMSWCGVREAKYRPDVVYGREGWADVPALTRGQVHAIGEPYLGRPGPRLVEGLRRLRRVVDAARTARDEAREAAGAA